MTTRPNAFTMRPDVSAKVRSLRNDSTKIKGGRVSADVQKGQVNSFNSIISSKRKEDKK